MIRTFNINFNGVDIPKWVKVQAVNTTVLPDLNHSFKQVAGGRGLRETGTTFGAKKIDIEFKIVVPTGTSLLQLQRDLAVWIKGNDFKLSPLIISDEPDLVYMAKIMDSVSISDNMFTGEGTLSFIVPSGIATHRLIKYGAFDYNQKELTVYYQGTAETYPTIKFTADVRIYNDYIEFKHLESGDSLKLWNIILNAGDTLEIDCNKKLVKLNGQLAMDMLGLESDWLKFEHRGINTIYCGMYGQMECSYKENWL